MHKDWLGNEITVGSSVIYAISSGHYARVVLGEVVEIKDEPDPYYGRRPDDFRQFSLVIQPIAESGTKGLDISRGVKWNWDGHTSHYTVEKPNLARIKNVEKVTVYHKPEGFDEMVAQMVQEAVDRNNARIAARDKQ
jgi:hypothetical protein